jgi:hypothetical protein
MAFLTDEQWYASFSHAGNYITQTHKRTNAQAHKRTSAQAHKHTKYMDVDAYGHLCAFITEN